MPQKCRFPFRGVVLYPAWPAKGNKAREGLHTGMRTSTGARHNTDAGAGILLRQKQLQHDTGLQARNRTKTNAARIIETRERAGAHKIQVWHDSKGQHQEHEENQVQDAGGQGSARREHKKKAGAI